MSVPSRGPADHELDAERLEVWRRQTRREADRTIRAMIQVYLEGATTRQQAVAAIERASAILHSDVRHYVAAQFVEALADYPAAVQPMLRLVDGGGR